jgi:hypothetical protein
MALYRYFARRIPGPNTGNFAFLPQSIPTESILGPGYSPLRQLMTTQPAQKQWLQALVEMSLQGIVHGTMNAQPISEGYTERGNI